DIDARAVSLQRGGSTGDAWVLSDEPVAETTLLPAPDRVSITRGTGPLPSRAAANLFWVARYVERAEATLRLAPPPGHPRGGRDHAGGRANWLAAPSVGRRAERPAACQAGAGGLRRIARPRPRRCASVPHRCRAIRRIGDPRSLFSRCLAGVDRPFRADQCA